MSRTQPSRSKLLSAVIVAFLVVVYITVAVIATFGGQ